MSDLIDFDSPNTNKGPLLASPLIPVPKNPVNDGQDASEAGSHFSEADKRRSMENNPFDMVMKKITEYEKNQEDPFERVIEKAKSFSGSVETKDNLITTGNRRYSDVLKMNKMMDKTDINLDLSIREDIEKLVLDENNMSIITDLNNTNLIEDSTDSKQVVKSWSCDNKVIPDVNILPLQTDPDLSILNNSAMNDSLLDHNIAKDLKYLSVNLKIHHRSMSQNIDTSPKKELPISKNRRSLSVNDGEKNDVFREDTTLPTAESYIFDDPMNNAFRKISLRSNLSSNCSDLSNQFDSTNSNQKLERLNSDSSVFSGLSNISAIQPDSQNQMRLKRFCSDSSAYSGISNLSIIPAHNSTSSFDSEISNNTINKAFLSSRSQLNSTSSNSVSLNSAAIKTPLKAGDKSDLIKKFFEIKTRMSINEMEQIKSDNINSIEDNSDVSKSNMNEKESLSNKDEKLIDVDNSSDSVFNDQTDRNDIIEHEARVLAQTFEKMAVKSTESNDEDLFFSKTQLNFDVLPPSDDEHEDNLIELPTSPERDSLLPQKNKSKEKISESNELSPKEKIKALEDEFIDHKDSNKKAMAATLLMDLEKLIKEERNPNASKVLTDLQKLLGVECDNNTEILQVCLQSTNTSPQSESKSKNESGADKNVPDMNIESANSENYSNVDSKNMSTNLKGISDVNQSGSNHKSDKNVEESGNIQLEKGCLIKQQSEITEHSNDMPEDHKLAMNLLQTLNKIVNEKNEDSVVSVLQNLGSVLSMATALRSKNQNKSFEVKKISQKPFNRSTNSLHKSPSPNNMNRKSQNKSFEVLPPRRSISNNQTYKSNHNLLEVPMSKEKRKSHLLNIKKRFPSDPGFTDSVIEKKKTENSISVEPPSINSNKSSGSPLKTKFKKKTSTEVVTKKGPLKAVIPLGSMHKRASIAQKMSVHTGNVTPPKTVDSLPSIKIVSSTPNSMTSNNSASNPAASSTPNVEGQKLQKIQSKQISKNTLNIIPKSLNSSLKETINVSKSSNKRMERTLSPQKRPATSKKNNEINGTESSKLPRFSPRPVRVRNYSLNDLKTAAKSPQTSISAPKISSEKKIQRNSSVLSPLRTCNKLENKAKPMRLISRLGKPAGIQTGPEKENYA